MTVAVLEEGSVVVHSRHGVLRVDRLEYREWQGRETLYATLVNDEIRLTVPVENFELVGIRPPVTKQDVADVFELLGKRNVREAAHFAQRLKQATERMNSNDIFMLAEVVRNFGRRSAKLSMAERDLFREALDRFCAELAVTAGITVDAMRTRVLTVVDPGTAA